MDLRVAKDFKIIQNELQTPPQKSNVVEVAQSLLSKAMDPTDPHSVPSEELLAKADDIINNSLVKNTISKLESVIQKKQKRKDISPVNEADNQKMKKQAIQRIEQFFTPSSTM